MLDSLFIGTSGLQTFSAGLKVISNNVANLNTPGFKSSDAVFANLYYGSPGEGAGQHTESDQQFGSGVMLGQTVVNFQSGEARQTGNPLDLSINGEGFFVAQGQGEAIYTRAGQFEFDKDGKLVLRGTDKQVLGIGPNGEQRAISLNGQRINPPKATGALTMNGNLSSSATDFSIATVQVIDAIGGEHTLKLNFTPKAGVPGTWTVKVLDGATEVSSGEIRFVGGVADPSASTIDFSYAPTGVSASTIKLDFSKEVTSFDTGATSTLAIKSSDGYAVGTLTTVSFEADGSMKLAYSNGQTSKGDRVALATFDSHDGLSPIGNSAFTHASREGVHIGAASQSGFGSIGSSQVEGSNVDIASEFSDLIVAQRGYQASSRIVSTANEMLQELFDMKGHR